ncbi:hypothetical protein EV385_6763 [Krasilnikovia cinnamomea]|uniref:Uncharacterized protein n=1 Tax=Krasilnikovia cinnamomea TaxID=349313 RepID=A0A4V2G5Z3_9ACTN|nr:hypothetical protein [Krasilnikovia cinnamomea]RZU46686.1 hypothetical protein EV385_6763 [Krasilnikovia cinnamomea]
METERFLALLQETLELTGRAVRRDLEPGFWVPRPSSPFDADLANTELGAQGVAWGATEPTYAFEMAQLGMIAVDDLIAGIRKLLDSPLPIFGQTVLARAAFENAATAFWLTDPQITVRQRVARAYLVIVDESSTALKITNEVGTSQQKAAAQTHLDTVRTHVTDLGLSLTGSGKNLAIDGEKSPSKTARVQALFAGSVPNLYKVIYSLYSGVTHGEMTGLLSRLHTPASGPTVWTLTPRQLTENVELALVAYRQLRRRLTAGGMGTRSDLPLQLWEENVGRRMQAIRARLV